MQPTRTVVGVDIAKRVFQLHWVDTETGELMKLRLTRGKFLEHFANRAPCFIGMEACGGAQHWARHLLTLGHSVRLLPAKMVRPFVSGNKNDAADAEAIWKAVQQPGLKTVAVKSEEQQGILALHRMRQQLVMFRTAQINGLRGLLTEYGEVMPRGRAGLRRDMAAALERVAERLPAMVIETLREQWARVAELDAEVDTIEQRIAIWHRQNAASRRIAAIPGVGVLSATAAVATMGDPAAFRSGREFAAWLGLVPRHAGMRRPRFSWTRIIRGESDVEGGGGHGWVEASAGSGVGADGGSPEGERRRRRPRGGWGGGLGAWAAVEREPETGRGSAASARRVAGDGLA